MKYNVVVKLYVTVEVEAADADEAMQAAEKHVLEEITLGEMPPVAEAESAFELSKKATGQ